MERCLKHGGFLRPRSANSKCCKALVCLECAKKSPITLDWKDKFDIFMAIVCLSLPFILLGCTVMFHECPKHVIDPKFKCVSIPQELKEHSQETQGPRGPPVMCKEPMRPPESSFIISSETAGAVAAVLIWVLFIIVPVLLYSFCCVAFVLTNKK